MEKELFQQITAALDSPKPENEVYSPLVLAYIGDTFYETVIRTKIISRGNASVNILNQKATFWAKAVTQGVMAKLLMEQELSETEITILKRGRNAHPASTARRASIAEYHLATGFESLIGSLYVNGQADRAVEIIRRGMELFEAAQAEKK